MSYIERSAPKNKAFLLKFPVIDRANVHLFKSGETSNFTLNAYHSDNNGADTSFSPTNSIAEIGATGVYRLLLSAAEMNHDEITFKYNTVNGQASLLVVKTFDEAARYKHMADVILRRVSDNVEASTVVGMDAENENSIYGLISYFMHNTQVTTGPNLITIKKHDKTTTLGTLDYTAVAGNPINGWQRS